MRPDEEEVKSRADYERRSGFQFRVTASMSLLKMPLQHLNPHIMCVLCGGYLVDATTIIECLHSFCRSCIVKYLQTSFHCPVCDVEVHKTKPLLHIRPDRPLQDIVNKLVPGLVFDEIKRRLEFQEKTEKSSDGDNTRGETTAENTNKTQTKRRSSAEENMEDPICITLEYYGKKRNWSERQIFPTRYLRCPSAVTVNVLKKFLVMKFAIPSTHQAALIRSDELLSDSLTMKEVSQIYGLYAKSFLDLQYSFLSVLHEETANNSAGKVDDVPRKKLKKCEDEEMPEPKLEENIIIKTEPPVVEPKQTLSEPEDGTSSEQAIENDILTTFPETPPSFELDVNELSSKQNEK